MKDYLINKTNQTIYKFNEELTGENVIEIENLVTILGGKTIHKNVNLSIKKGESSIIIGGSGSGKSVLLKVMVGLIKAYSGKVRLLGHDIVKATDKQLWDIAKDIGVLFQGGALFDSMTINDNVAFLLRRFTNKNENEIKKIVKEKLEQVGLTDVENKMPSEISVGMAKRAGLARAIVLDPKIIFYDEPTTGLDPVMADNINDLILKLQRELNITSIVVTHDMESAYKVGNKISMLYEGGMIFTGTPLEIKKSDNIYVQKFINGDSEGLGEVIG